MKLYRTEAELEFLPEEQQEFYTSMLADDEFLLIAVRDELIIVSAAILESRQALREAEFERKFGFSKDQTRQIQRRIVETLRPVRRNEPLEESPSEFGSPKRYLHMRLYCGQEEFEQLEDRKQHLYSTSPDVDSGEEIFAVTIEELEVYIAFVRFSLEAVDEREYENRTDFTREYARSVMEQMEQILQELREREA